MSEENKNGRVTLRDIMKLQKETLEKIAELEVEIAVLKVRVSLISGFVALVISLAIKFLPKIL